MNECSGRKKGSLVSAEMRCGNPATGFSGTLIPGLLFHRNLDILFAFFVVWDGHIASDISR